MNGRGNLWQRKRSRKPTLLFFSPDYSKKIKKSQNSYHVASRVGYQGARCPVGNQAGNDKYTTGKYTMNLRSRFRIGTWNVRKLKELGKLDTICNEMDRHNIEILTSRHMKQRQLFILEKMKAQVVATEWQLSYQKNRQNHSWATILFLTESSN